MIGSWPHPESGSEYAVTFDSGRQNRLLVLPALFDEGNKMRHFTVQVMRLLDKAGWDSALPDLPGQNESLTPLDQQSFASWKEAAAQCATWFGATHVLTLRGAAALAPEGLAGWHYAAANPSSQLRGMLRGRVIAARELGAQENRDDLLELGKADGLELGGYRLSATMIAELAEAKLADTKHQTIVQSALGGGGLWLRAEPDHSPDQAEKLANIICGKNA